MRTFMLCSLLFLLLIFLGAGAWALGYIARPALDSNASTLVGIGMAYADARRHPVQKDTLPCTLHAIQSIPQPCNP